MALGLNFFNTPAKIQKLPIQEPQQIAGINQLFEQGLKNFNPDIQEQYARKQFAKQLPGLEQKLNMLSGGQQRGQAANYELGGLQADLESNLAGQRYQAGQKQLQFGLTPQNEYLYSGEQPGLGQELASKAVGSFAENIPGLIGKGIEAWGSRGRNQQNQNQTSQTTTTTPTGKTSTELAASTTEQALNNLTPPTRSPNAADLVSPSTGNIAADAFNNPSLTPFTRQALAKTKLPQTAETAKALENVGKPAQGWSYAGDVGKNAAQTAGWVASGVPAPLAVIGGIGKTAWDLYSRYKNWKKS